MTEALTFFSLFHILDDFTLFHPPLLELVFS